MKKKIIIGTILASAMAVSLYASGHNGSNYGEMRNCPNNGAMKSYSNMKIKNMMYDYGSKYQGMRKCSNRQRGHSMMEMHRGYMRMFAGLKLSQEQMYKFSILKDEMRLDMKKLRGFNHKSKIAKFISKDGFDKDAFEQYSNSMHKKRADIRADFMEEAFKVLTKDQIIKLKNNLTKS